MAKNTCDVDQKNQSRQQCIDRGRNSGGAPLNRFDEIYAFVEDVEFLSVEPDGVNISVVRNGRAAFRKKIVWSQSNREIWFGCPCIIDYNGDLPTEGTSGSLYLHESIVNEGSLSQRPKFPHDFDEDRPYYKLPVQSEKIELKGFFYDGSGVARSIEVELFDAGAVEKRQDVINTGKSTLLHLTSEFLAGLDLGLPLDQPLRVFPARIDLTGRYVDDDVDHGPGTVNLLDLTIARQSQEVKFRLKKVSLMLSVDGLVEFGHTGSLGGLKAAVEALNLFKQNPPTSDEERLKLKSAEKLISSWRKKGEAASAVLSGIKPG